MTTLSQQCRFFAGKHVDVHDGRCFLPGSLPQSTEIFYEGTLLFDRSLVEAVQGIALSS